MIRGRPSATALLVALSVVREGHRYALPPIAMRLAQEALNRAGRWWRLALAWANNGLGRRVLAVLEALCLPGLAAHHCRRKRWLLQRLQAEGSPRTWLWLGVGYDGSALALQSRLPGIRVLELDHPDSLALRRGLPVFREHRCPAHATVAIELPGQFEHLVALCAKAPCTLVAEGLAMYLPPRELLRGLRRLAVLPHPPRVLFSALQPTHANGHGFARARGLSDLWLARQGEPFIWRLQMARLVGLLQKHGYRVDAHWNGDGFGEYVLDANPATASVT